jgi:hypothetical protein
MMAVFILLYQDFNGKSYEGYWWKVISVNNEIVVNPVIIIPARTTMALRLTEKQVQYCISRGATVYELAIDRGIPVIINAVNPSNTETVAPTVVEPEVKETTVESTVSEPAATFTISSNNESKIVYDPNGCSIIAEDDVVTTTEEVTEPVVESTEDVQKEEQVQEETVEEKPQYQNNYTKKNKKNKR